MSTRFVTQFMTKDLLLCRKDLKQFLIYGDHRYTRKKINSWAFNRNVSHVSSMRWSLWNLSPVKFLESLICFLTVHPICYCLGRTALLALEYPQHHLKKFFTIWPLFSTSHPPHCYCDVCFLTWTIVFSVNLFNASLPCQRMSKTYLTLNDWDYTT